MLAYTYMSNKKSNRELATINIRLYPRTHKVLKNLALRTGKTIARIVDESVALFAHEKND